MTHDAAMPPGSDAAPGRLPTLQDVPPAPRQPSPAAHRLIFEYRGSQALMLWIGAGLLIMGLGFTTLTCWGLPVDLAIAVGPVRTVGTILSAETNGGLSIGGVHPTHVRYAFESSGTRWEGECDTFGVAPGQRGSIRIEHASFSPDWSRVDGETHANSKPGYWALWILVIPGAGAVALALAVRSNRREVRAFTHGRAALARITFRGVDGSVDFNGRHPFLIRWEFRTENGDVHEGSITSMKLLELEPYAESEELVVLYDPADPRVNTMFVA